jgi:hypothetical protein
MSTGVCKRGFASFYNEGGLRGWVAKNKAPYALAGIKPFRRIFRRLDFDYSASYSDWLHRVG